ncbi:hypothetical protein [Parasitella parasitica]|uniref:Ndc10 domain-containing protein n=1 Tax=Parasitella parasitica TaxID=35722 RepID=A0A0B7NFN3_9FUNG|nr:hypothetical protein [Parasitella parasitica]
MACTQQKCRRNNQNVSDNHGEGSSTADLDLRWKTIKQLDQRLEIECRIYNANNLEGPGENSIQDGYTFEQMILVSQNHLNAEKYIGSNLRDRMTLLLNHMMMLRGEVSRFIDLKHCFSLEFKDEGPTRCPVFVMMIVNGKTNQEHKKLYSGVIRHKEVNACAFGALGFYLFQRFHEDGEDFPRFEDKSDQFPIKLCKGQDHKSSIAPSTKIDAVHRAFKLAGVKSKKLTHAGRGSGARDAEMAGASVDHIKRMGRWSLDTVENVYLPCLPCTAIRIMSEFPEQIGCYRLPRALVTPPESLLCMVFPGYDACKESGISDVNSEHNTICGVGFLRLLKELRVIILQDAVLLRQQNSKSLIWRNKIFKSQEFEAFARDSLQAMATAQVTAALEIRRTMSFVEERFGQIQNALVAQARQVEQLFTASAAPANNDLASQLAAINANVTSLRSEIQAMNSRFTSARVIDGGRVTFEQAQPSTPTPTANEEAQSSSMKSPNHNSVQDLWDEWTKRMNGHPSIRNLNTKYGTKRGTKWRRGSKVLITEVKRIANERGLGDDDAVQYLDQKKM